MAIEFENKPLRWDSEGAEPSEELKTTGFQAGYKPPAQIFNYQLHNTSACLTEIQNQTSNLDDTKANTDLTNLTGTLSIKDGGTGATDIYNAQNNLGLMKRYTNFNHLTLEEGYTLKDVFLAMADNTYIEYSIKSNDNITVTPITSGFLRIVRSHAYFGYAEFFGNVISENSMWVGSLHAERGFTWNKVWTSNKTIPVENGGTGATTASEGLAALGGASEDLTNVDNTVFAEKAASAGGTGFKIGKNLTGQTVSIDYDGTTETTVTAGTNAEIFNDLRERTYVFDDISQRYIANTGNVASGPYCHAEGGCTTANDMFSHAEGWRTIASKAEAHAEGSHTIASSNASHAEGGFTTASGYCSHSEGYFTTASGGQSHSEGHNTTASGVSAHAEGSDTIASGMDSHAEGKQTTATGYTCHAEGAKTTAGGYHSHAGGYSTTSHNYQLVHGKFNKLSNGATNEFDSTGDIFIIGNGTSGSERSNAFRVTTAGKAYGLSNFSGSGADYAEMWEIEGGNPDGEDWRGLFVTVNENNKISKANSNDYILGVISATPCVVGDVQSEIWHDMYLKDVFGEKLVETVEVEESTDEQGVVTPAHTEKRWVLNPKYDPTQEYISRDERPEWATVGLVGKLIVIDDGTCKPGQFCKVADGGTATASSNNEGYRVLERKDDTHIQILLR